MMQERSVSAAPGFPRRCRDHRGQLVRRQPPRLDRGPEGTLETLQVNGVHGCVQGVDRAGVRL